ncbi:MAG: UDP-N-acetylglucosamine 1-carboxyvinyltransferase [Solitalea-like symbiont of Tyrophagus putrescentiae]
MASFIINGGKRLKGVVIPQGAKNEALQVISAVLLTEELVVIKNIPQISDVLSLIKILELLGVQVKKIDDNDYSFKAKNINLDFFQTDTFSEKSSSLRGSILLLGPILARFKKAYMHQPGGDKIGRRSLDTHFIALQELGAKFTTLEDKKTFVVDATKIKSGYILLEEASVTGTANVIMTTVLLKGTTTIYNAACEPYIQQLCHMLNSMGAKISGISSNLLTIEGVESLGGTSHDILPDMIEVGSFIGLAAITQSHLTIKNVKYNMLGVIPKAFKSLGIEIKRQDDDIIIPPQGIYKIHQPLDKNILTIYDAPWPGLTPDLLSIILVTAIQAKGTILIHQKMFESRLFFIDRLIYMGAQIILCDPHRANVIGLAQTSKLKSTTMYSPDIRAGIALLIAALSAEGTSVIKNIEQIDRGYQDIDGRLNLLGADINRVQI